MLYHAYEMTHAAISPLRTMAKFNMRTLRDPFNPFAPSLPARTTAAALDMFLSATRRYGKPEFNIDSVEIEGRSVSVIEEVVVEKPFCDLIHFRRQGAADRNDPAVLIVAPMSGHFATLLRGTVQAMLPTHEVYVTDWIDVRNVPLSEGRFGLDDYIDYLCGFCGVLHSIRGERPAVMGVCQPGVPLLAAASLMAEDGDEHRPSTIVLMGSPIDTTRSPTEPNVLATTRPLSWFEKNVIVTVPFPNPGFMRRVYPGFLQLSGFMQMNLDRHVGAHMDQFQHLIQGDGDSVEAHNKFYDEYLAVMDMTAEFYLETIETVFQKHSLPRGEMVYRGKRPVRPEAITDIALMTVEGEKDDITGRGQTAAAHGLCANLPGAKKFHWEQEKVGHYGVFNGSRFRSSIQPKVAGFIAENRRNGAPLRKPALTLVSSTETPRAASPQATPDVTPPKAVAVGAATAKPAPKPRKAAAKPATRARKAAPVAKAAAAKPAATTAATTATTTAAAKTAPPRKTARKTPMKATPPKAAPANPAPEKPAAAKPAAAKTAAAKPAAAKTATANVSPAKSATAKAPAPKPAAPKTRAAKTAAAKTGAAKTAASKAEASETAPAKVEAPKAAPAKPARSRTVAAKSTPAARVAGAAQARRAARRKTKPAPDEK